MKKKEIYEESLMRGMRDCIKDEINSAIKLCHLNFAWNAEAIYIRKYAQLFNQFIITQKKIESRHLKMISDLEQELQEKLNYTTKEILSPTIKNIKYITHKFALKKELYIICHNLVKLNEKRRATHINQTSKKQ